MLVLRNCKLVPELTEGTDLREADILVAGEYIKDIFPVGSRIEDVEELDMGGKTIMPGLIDAHVHLFFWTDESASRRGIHCSQQSI